MKPDVTINDLFNGTYSATIKGATQAQADKIKAALNAAYETAILPSEKAAFTAVFRSANGAIIIVENATAYVNYKTTDDGKTLYLSLTCVNGSELQAKLTAAVKAMDTPKAEIAKAIVPVYNRAAMNRDNRIAAVAFKNRQYC